MSKGSERSNNILFASAFISTAFGFIVFSSFFTTMPILYDLNVFSDTNLQPDAPGTYAIVEMTISLATFLLGAVGSYSLIGTKSTNSQSQSILGGIYTIFFLTETYILYQRLYELGYMSQYGIIENVGCNDTSILGCPTSRYIHYSEQANSTLPLLITKENCIFNVYDAENLNSGTKLDWSLLENYDYNKQNDIVAAAQSTGLSIESKDLPQGLHKCWYWGCSEVCNDRYRINLLWLIGSMVSWLTYLILLGLSFGAASSMSKDKQDYISLSVDSDQEKNEPLKRRTRLHFH